MERGCAEGPEEGTRVAWRGGGRKETAGSSSTLLPSAAVKMRTTLPLELAVASNLPSRDSATHIDAGAMRGHVDAGAPAAHLHLPLGQAWEPKRSHSSAYARPN